MKKIKSKTKSRLSKAYLNSKSKVWFASPLELSRHTKVPLTKVKEWLKSRDEYTVHKAIRKRTFKRRRIIVGGPVQQFQADLIDVQNLSSHNEDFRYLLTVIDCFSRYAWVIPLKNKQADTLIEAFKRLFKKKKARPRVLQTDKGSEFVNRKFQAFLKQQKVRFFTTENEDVKSAIIERFNQTLQGKMWKFFTHSNSYRFVEKLPRLVKSYNRRTHSTLGMPPVKVNRKNTPMLFHRMYDDLRMSEREHTQFKVGDRVRLRQTKGVFHKGFRPTWTPELFTVCQVHNTTPATYSVKDDLKETIKGRFYGEELQKVTDSGVYKIEQIIKTRKLKGKREYLVKWWGYPAKFNSWIKQSDLIDGRKRK